MCIFTKEFYIKATQVPKETFFLFLFSFAEGNIFIVIYNYNITIYVMLVYCSNNINNKKAYFKYVHSLYYVILYY